MTVYTEIYAYSGFSFLDGASDLDQLDGATVRVSMAVLSVETVIVRALHAGDTNCAAGWRRLSSTSIITTVRARFDEVNPTTFTPHSAELFQPAGVFIVNHDVIVCHSASECLIHGPTSDNGVFSARSCLGGYYLIHGATSNNVTSYFATLGPAGMLNRGRLRSAIGWRRNGTMLTPVTTISANFAAVISANSTSHGWRVAHIATVITVSPDALVCASARNFRWRVVARHG